MEEGYTEDGDQVVDEGDDLEDDDEPIEPIKPIKDPAGGDLGPPTDIPGKPAYTDRTLYDIDRDDAGLIQSIDYKNGQSVEFAYDDEGNVATIVDTASGVTMMKTSEGWQAVSPNGDKTVIEGEVSVDQETGNITVKMDDGTTVTNYPNGRITTTDADGNLTAVHNPDQWVEGPHGNWLRSPVNATAKYDADGNLVQANDGHGRTYTRQQDGSWKVSSMDSAFSSGQSGVVFDGAVTMDPIRGVVATPNRYVPPAVTSGQPS